LFLLFKLSSPVTRKRGILEESAPAQELSIPEFSGCFFDFLSVNLLIVRSHQAKIIIVMRLIQGRKNVVDETGTTTRWELKVIVTTSVGQREIKKSRHF